MQREKRVWYRIAGHLMELTVPEESNVDRLFPSFKPFQCVPDENQITVCAIRLITEQLDFENDTLIILHEEFGLIGYWFCLKETTGQYIIDTQFLENGPTYRITSDKTFSKATVYMNPGDKNAVNILSSFTSIVFAQSAIMHKTLLIHASVIEKDGLGYAFLGKSGTGKSTHSSMWLQYIEGSTLLNDDNPAIRIESDGSVNVYGTPWSGKTHCYKNRKVALRALVRLEKAPTNNYVRKQGVEALLTLLPSCSSMPWNEKLYSEMCNIATEVVSNVRVGLLKCLPDKEAAIICYAESK
ncbi:MAG: hypothetical protein LBE56_13445 [Tannerella sp.]|nr:hypothetical protein [Tannerella sp.]